MPVAAIIQFVQLAIAAAPTAERVVRDGIALIQSLTSQNLITLDQQSKLMAWADAHQSAVLAGTPPPEFIVV